MSKMIDNLQNQTSWSVRQCVICDSKSIGINFGAPTCAPCKAFFRRNARRKDILETSCQHHDQDLSLIDNEDRTIEFLHIRRCSSCRLRRCFDMGMKEELVRTDEENIRHRQLVDVNRRRRELIRAKRKERQLLIPQYVANKNELLHESDWRHLSNIVAAYDTHCLKTYLQQRSAMFINGSTYQDENIALKYYTILPMNLAISLLSFLRSLPVLQSLSHMNRTYLYQNNLRSLLFPHLFELNQVCFSEPWQTSLDEATWKWICGPELFEEFIITEKLAERSLITDPIITRLWMIILFFSSSLFSLYDANKSIRTPKKKIAISEIQNAYVILLWNYLSHRYGNDAVRIYSNLIHVYLKMQHTGFNISVQLRTRTDLFIVHKALNQLLTMDIRDS